MRGQCRALGQMGEDLPLGPVFLASKPLASLEDDWRMRQVGGSHLAGSPTQAKK